MPKRQLGLSIYPDHTDFSKNRDYLNLGFKYGFKRLFISMLEVGDNLQETKEKYQKIIDYANLLGYEIFIDVNPALFRQFKINLDDLSFFSHLGVTGIRLDQAFDGEKEALMSFNPDGLVLELNMSNDVSYLDNVMDHEPNRPFIYGCHNFYPQRGTGLSWEYFIKASRRFKKYGLHTAAFVNSKSAKIGPWKISDGLPTLEMARDLPIDVQAKQLWASGLIDDVIIGNCYASEAELKDLSQVNRYQTVFDIQFMSKTSSLEKDICLKNQHEVRGDLNETVIRSSRVRKIYSDSPNPVHDNERAFEPGDVVIGNDQFGEYKNELQLVLKKHSDQRKNLVAKINPKEKFLINYLKPWSKFRLRVRK